MIKFKTSDKLGLVADIVQMQCFGIDNIRDMYDLRFAGGTDKFSQLCAVKFKSKLPTHQFPVFILAFVPRLRNKKYHSQQKNHAEWYIYKHVSVGQLDILTPEQLFINYGFDINEFFDSDIFSVIKTRFIQTIEMGLKDKIPQFVSTLKSPLEQREANTLISSIEKSLEILKHNAQDVNDKYYKISSRILSDAELDEKIEQELTRQGIYTDLNYTVESDEISETIDDWKCEVKKEIENGKPVFKIYEIDSGLWVATFPDETTAKNFADEYPEMKNKYLNS